VYHVKTQVLLHSVLTRNFSECVSQSIQCIYKNIHTHMCVCVCVDIYMCCMSPRDTNRIAEFPDAEFCRKSIQCIHKNIHIYTT
jgi:hypothetical protein